MVLIFAISVLRFEVLLPLSIKIGFIPDSKSCKEAKSPAGPEPTTITFFSPFAFFHFGENFLSSGLSPT